MPHTPDLSILYCGLQGKLISEPVVIKPVVENREAKTSEAKPKVVRKNNGAPIIEDWVSDTRKDARKTVNHVEQNRQNTHASRGNQRN
ncbi:hypothetical protein Tco_1142644 [Tanacetum coccineum]